MASPLARSFFFSFPRPSALNSRTPLPLSPPPPPSVGLEPSASALGTASAQIAESVAGRWWGERKSLVLAGRWLGGRETRKRDLSSRQGSLSRQRDLASPRGALNKKLDTQTRGRGLQNMASKDKAVGGGGGGGGGGHGSGRAASTGNEVWTHSTAPASLKFKFKFYFRQLTKDNPSAFDRLQMDRVGSYSVTDARSAEKTSDLIIKHLGVTRDVVRKNVSVIDGCACIGGNTISFAKRFAHVEAVEFSAQRAGILRNNLQVLGLGSAVKVVNDDFIGLIPSLDFDVVFLDPPWGGEGYQEREFIDIVMGELEEEEEEGGGRWRRRRRRRKRRRRRRTRGGERKG